MTSSAPTQSSTPHTTASPSTQIQPITTWDGHVAHMEACYMSLEKLGYEVPLAVHQRARQRLSDAREYANVFHSTMWDQKNDKKTNRSESEKRDRILQSYYFRSKLPEAYYAYAIVESKKRGASASKVEPLTSWEAHMKNCNNILSDNIKEAYAYAQAFCYAQTIDGKTLTYDQWREQTDELMNISNLINSMENRAKLNAWHQRFIQSQTQTAAPSPSTVDMKSQSSAGSPSGVPAATTASVSVATPSTAASLSRQATGSAGAKSGGASAGALLNVPAATSTRLLPHGDPRKRTRSPSSQPRAATASRRSTATAAAAVHVADSKQKTSSWWSSFFGGSSDSQPSVNKVKPTQFKKKSLAQPLLPMGQGSTARQVPAPAAAKK